MSRKFDFREKLNFDDIDLTAPDKVIEEILSQLPEATNGMVLGTIQTYTGNVFSYTKPSFLGVAEALGTVEKNVNIQEELGQIGQETHKFECFLYTPEYDKYKYRVFFVKYDVASYPVSIILDESVAESISSLNTGYVYRCNTRDELEGLRYQIFESKRMIAIMQELIRINQAKKAEKMHMQDSDANDTD